MATEKEVNEFHDSSDVNASKLAQHHTLGMGVNEAAPGRHNHDGINSIQDIQPLRGVTLSGSRATDAWRLQINAALVKLGAVDTTTA